MSGVLEELKLLLTDIMESGFFSVSAETIRQLGCFSGKMEKYGLHEGGRLAGELEIILERSRHSTKKEGKEASDCFCTLWEYIRLCEARLGYELAVRNMEGTE